MEHKRQDGHSQDFAHRYMDVAPIIVTLLGSFAVRFDERSAGPWPRPSAKRVCELLMLRPDHKLVKEVAREILFANLAPDASANALRRAASMARQALSALGEVGPRLLQGDRHHIWVPSNIRLEIDLVSHKAALRRALAMEPGAQRDAALSTALLEDGVLLDNEPYSDWALEARDGLEVLRQTARLELARDRANGHGRSRPTSVIDAWEACLAPEPGSEEAAIALMRAYAALGQRQLVVRTYRRCRVGLQELGLRPSAALERNYLSATDEVAEFGPPGPNEKLDWATNLSASLPELIDLREEESAAC